MMEGINILEKTEIRNWSSIYCKAMIVIAVIFVLTLTLSIVLENLKFLVVSSIAFCVVVAMFLLGDLTAKGTGKYEYKVTIDDNVSLTEFNEKYDIIEHHDNSKIYTIKEK